MNWKDVGEKTLLLNDANQRHNTMNKFSNVDSTQSTTYVVSLSEFAFIRPRGVLL